MQCSKNLRRMCCRSLQDSLRHTFQAVTWWEDLHEVQEGGVVGEAGAQPQGRAGCIQQDILKALRREPLHHSNAVVWQNWMGSELKT